MLQAAGDVAKDRLTRLFRFLAEFNAVKTPPIRSTQEYEWTLSLSSLPRDPSIQLGQIALSKSNGSIASGPVDGVILRVKRPKETPCPPPPEILDGWILTGWQAPDHDAEFVQQRNFASKETTQTIAFDDDEDRVDAFEKWQEERNLWAIAERPVRKATAVFRRLFELRGRLEREAEKVQLYLGDGILRIADTVGVIDHPLLTQRIELQFDAKVPEFTIVETDDPPELNTALFRTMPSIEGQLIGRCREDLEQTGFHPLGGDDTNGYLESVVHRLFADGRLAKNSDQLPAKPATAIVYRSALLYLAPRSLGVANAIDGFLERLNQTSDARELSPALTRLVGIDLEAPESQSTTQLSENQSQPSLDADVDLLLTKPANPEQERIVKRLAGTGSVLVQGPPGTGKSHTIANLIGHLLAQGKSILVTSHTAKALRVVRQHVVDSLRPLCVSVLDTDANSRGELDEAVRGIVSRLSNSDLGELQERIKRLGAERGKLKQRITQLQQALERAVRDEYDSITVAGEEISPAKAARFVAEGREEHSWIPGPVEPSAALPLDENEINELYQLNDLLPPDDEHDLSGTLPRLTDLPDDLSFDGLATRIASLRSKELDVNELWWPNNATYDEERLRLLRDALNSALKLIKGQPRWYLEAVDAGRSGDAKRAPWDELIQMIQENCTLIAECKRLIVSRGPELSSKFSFDVKLRILGEIVKHLQGGGTLRILSLAKAPHWWYLLRDAKVDGKAPSSLDDIKALEALLLLEDRRAALRRRWDRQMADFGEPIPEKARAAPEDLCFQKLPGLRESLGWHQSHWIHCERQMEEAGIKWSVALELVGPTAEACAHLQRTYAVVKKFVLPLIERRIEFLELQRLESQHADILKRLSAIPNQDDSSGLVRLLRQAALDLDSDGYTTSWLRLVELVGQAKRLQRRHELLARLQACASGWATAVRNRTAPHDRSVAAGVPTRAWLQRQWEQEIQRRAAVNSDSLQQELNELREKLHDVTSRYVDALTWAAQRKRTSLRQQQSLEGWRALVRTPGFSKGVRSARLKAEARERLAECRGAVPVWIMPMSRVVDSYDLRSTRFDVVIIDESSQSDITGLLAFALGKDVVVVGDNEQVSPYSVGVDSTQLQAIIDEYLEEIPNWQMYHGRTSVYDLAATCFGERIRLIEHFRSVNDIIQFSNDLCYGGEIKPLRDSSNISTRPFVVAHRVAGASKDGDVNEIEALEVASLLIATTEQDEYQGKSIGVICLVGDRQAMRIDELIQRHISESVYTNRRILCGNPAHFQGDERDVMFLSVVDSSPLGQPLPMKQADDFKKRFNVAASRARDQMWVVHSLNPDNELKAGDLRLRLIKHAEDPQALVRQLATCAQRADSEFEREVIRRLTTAGYRVMAQWPVGAYRIDIVVIGENDAKAAIECDGDRFHPPEQLGADLARQSMLERLGWRFIRIRSTAFFSAPDRAMNSVFKRLDCLGVRPIGAESHLERSESDDQLRQRIVRRADELRRTWAKSDLSGTTDEQLPTTAEYVPSVVPVQNLLRAEYATAQLDLVTSSSNPGVHAPLPEPKSGGEADHQAVVALLKRAKAPLSSDQISSSLELSRSRFDTVVVDLMACGRLVQVNSSSVTKYKLTD